MAADRTPVGSHLVAGGALATAGLRYTDEIGAEAVQVFVGNPRGWAASAGDARADERFGTGCADRGVAVFVHSPYLVNLGSPTELTRARSAASVRHSLHRGRRIGARGVVIHAGAAVDAVRRDEAVRQTRESLLPILDGLRDDDADVLLEPTAGGGCPLAATVDQLGHLVAALEGHPRLGVCVDTCHLFAAGHDVRAGAVAAVLTGLARAVGADRLRLVHANDSKDPLGSKRDRHENIGAGEIGAAAFGELMRHPAVRRVPVVVETPGGVEAHRRDVALLKSLRDG